MPWLLDWSQNDGIGRAYELTANHMHAHQTLWNIAPLTYFLSRWFQQTEKWGLAFSLVGWFTAFHMLPLWYLRVVVDSNWQRWWQKRTKHANTKNMICNTGIFRTRKNDFQHPVQHEDNNGVDSSSTEDIDVIFGRSEQNKRKKYEYLSLLLFFVVHLGKVLAYATHIHE